MNIKNLLSSMICLVLAMSANARNVISFNSDWTFNDQPVTIPHTWNAYDMQVRYNDFLQGANYYRKHFTPDESLKGKRIYLRFEGVGSCAEVYVNHQMVGTHKGGYSAFVVEIGKELKWGEDNLIVVKADNTARPDVIPVNHVLFGVYGGIYRPVWLVATDSCSIAVNDYASPGIYIRQKNVNKKGADVSVKVKLDNATFKTVALTLETSIYTSTGKKIASKMDPIQVSSQGIQSFYQNFHLTNPHLWQGRKDPYLYKMVTRVLRNGKEIDSIVQPLGLRHYEIIAGKGFYLNGERYPMYGVCRHQDRWGLGSAITNKEHKEDLDLIMEVGATTVRFAHYQQSDYIYSRCDTLGLIVWAEIPFVNRVTGEESENAQQQLRELIRQQYNHPSIYIWGLHNEVYKPHEYTSQLTATLHDIAKTEDPDRYTVSTNGYGIMNHPVNLNADVQAMNRYYGWYEGEIKDIDNWIENLENNYPEQRFILSEYGADGNIFQQTEYLGESLDWTKPYYPETFETKVHEYQWNAIRKHPYIIASYLWNMFDFATPMANRGGIPARNMKGLITFDRKIKKDVFYFYKANWSQSPVLYITQRRNTEREKKQTSITIYSNIGTPKVYLNGQELTKFHKGYTDIHYIFEPVTLAMGKNTIRTIAEKNGKEYVDEIIWYYNGEKNRGPGHYINKETHGGL